MEQIRNSLMSAQQYNTGLIICVRHYRRIGHYMVIKPFFTSAKEVMFLPVFVCLSVCLFVYVLAR